MRIRPLAEEDVGRAARLLWAALPPHGEDGDARMRAKLAQGLAHDPEGFLVAEDEDGLTGIALAVRREEIWVLAWLGVHPGARSAGVGGRLLEAALAYGAGCRGFLIASSDDARAMRLYAQAGFDVHPSVLARGRASPERAPDLSRVREGGAEDVEHCVRIDRAVRGGGRGIDVTAWLDSGDRLWRTPSGYAVGRQGRPMTVAATDEEEASLLLWRVLLDGGEDESEVHWITARQGWAVRTVLDAGLKLDRGYAYFTRGELGPLTPWLPNNSLL